MSRDGQIQEVFVGDYLLAFDGRVLEVFNTHEGFNRIHIAHMRLKVQEGRKGRLLVEVTARRRNTPREIFEVKPEERPMFEAMVAEIREAADSAGYELAS